MLSEGSQDPVSGLWRDGLICNLKTGPLREIYANATHLAATVEMANYEDEYDVAVIDEIQMIKDDFRGAEWMRALLGVKAKEIHICGDEKAFRIVSELLSLTDDELTVHKYARLSPLITEDQPFNSWDDLRDGDCIIGFSKGKLFDMRNEINEYMNRDQDGNPSGSLDNHCAMIYGSMPPELKLK